MSQFKVPYAQIREAIIELDENFLYGDIPSKLVECVPTKEEIDLVTEFQGNYEQLGKAEQFFLEVKNIPSLALRLKSFAFKIKFQEMIDELRPVCLPPATNNVVLTFISGYNSGHQSIR